MRIAEDTKNGEIKLGELIVVSLVVLEYMRNENVDYFFNDYNKMGIMWMIRPWILLIEEKHLVPAIKLNNTDNIN